MNIVITDNTPPVEITITENNVPVFVSVCNRKPVVYIEIKEGGGGSGTIKWSEILEKPLTFTPSAHTHDWSDIRNAPTVFPPATHTHTWSQIAEKPFLFSGNYNDLDNIPVTFAPSAHTHQWREITNKPNFFSGDYNDLNNAPDISGKENTANKQNSLAVDGNGIKFPTVDAVNQKNTSQDSAITSNANTIASEVQNRIDGDQDLQNQLNLEIGVRQQTDLKNAEQDTILISLESLQITTNLDSTLTISNKNISSNISILTEEFVYINNSSFVLLYKPGQILGVYHNGLLLRFQDYTYNMNKTITLNKPLTEDDVIRIHYTHFIIES